jgi:YD repeat-containing protein
MLTWQYAPHATDSNPAFPLTCDDLAMGFLYDPASQVTNILHQLTATSSQINKAEYGYNAVGNRTSLTDRRGSQAFAYDAVGNRTTGEQRKGVGMSYPGFCGHQVKSH